MISQKTACAELLLFRKLYDISVQLDGDDVTKEEYEQKLGDAFDSEKAEDINQNIYTYEQCRLLLEALR